MGLTKPIPPKMRMEMSYDDFYKYCCIEDEECGGVIQWHHNLESYLNGNRGRVNEIFCILPVCKHHHDLATYNQLVRRRLDEVMISRATLEEMQKWCLKELYQRRHGNP